MVCIRLVNISRYLQYKKIVLLLLLQVLILLRKVEMGMDDIVFPPLRDAVDFFPGKYQKIPG